MAHVSWSVSVLGTEVQRFCAQQRWVVLDSGMHRNAVRWADLCGPAEPFVRCRSRPSQQGAIYGRFAYGITSGWACSAHGWTVKKRLDWSRALWWTYFCEPKEPCITWGCTLAPPGEYDWTIRARWRYGLRSNYFDTCLSFLGRIVCSQCIDADYCYRHRCKERQRKFF